MAEKLISILGDSISTYEGYNPDDYPVFYAGEQCEKSGSYLFPHFWHTKVSFEVCLMLGE